MRARVSITVKLFLGFLGLLVLALGLLAGLATSWFVQQESANLNSFLDSEAKVVSSRLEGMVEGLALYGVVRPADVRPALRHEIDSYLEQRLNRPIPYKTTLLILDDQGGVLGQSNLALDLSQNVPSLALGATRIQDIQDEGPAYRVLTARFQLGQKAYGTFRVASLLSSLEAPLLSFLTSLALVLGGGLVVLTALGYWLIVAVLGPVRRMADAATQISDQNLGARIPLPPGNDDLHRLAATFNTLLSRLETEFAFQERLVGELTHQLKTPLTVLRGRNELGLTTNRGAEDLRELVEDNLSDIDAMVNLLNSILELARYESRIDKLQTVGLDVGTFVETLGAELEPLWTSKQFEFRATGPQVTINADPTALRQILMNLYDNAWKYGDGGTAIETSWAVEGHELKLAVSNRGPAIPEGDLELVFRRFYRSATVRQETGGSGLGLAVVRSLVGLHGGTVRALNQPPGHVTIELRWPLPLPVSIE